MTTVAKQRRFTVDPGRTILRDGENFIRIERLTDGALSPAECDDITHAIAALLNQTSGRLLATLARKNREGK